MSEALYAPPEAAITVDATDELDYYVVSPRKFYLLAILTLNLYLVYWFYRNWSQIKKKNNESMWPPMRGLFYIFFTHSLFTDINEKIKSLGRSFDWQPNVLATGFVLLTILSNVLDRLSAKSIGSPLTDLVSLALVPILPALLLKGQRAINIACDDPEGVGNGGLTVANWVWMVLGGLLWLVILFGVYALMFAPHLLAE
jgi:hypothetical protein